jgi:hypothetical protein
MFAFLIVFSKFTFLSVNVTLKVAQKWGLIWYSQPFQLQLVVSQRLLSRPWCSPVILITDLTKLHIYLHPFIIEGKKTIYKVSGFPLFIQNLKLWFCTCHSNLTRNSKWCEAVLRKQSCTVTLKSPLKWNLLIRQAVYCSSLESEKNNLAWEKEFIDIYARRKNDVT